MKYGRRVGNTALIVASAFALSGFPGHAAEPPAGLLRKIAERELQNSQARDNYTYRQSVTVEEFNKNGGAGGRFHEVRDITFVPNQGRYEKVVEPARNSMTHLQLTPEDFNDIRNIQPFLLTPDAVPLYQGQYKGEETMDGVRCFVEFIRPRQILSTQRFFEGLLWVRESDLAIIRSEGKAVPEIETLREQNLFPHFTTIRHEIDGKWLFPVETYADDTLYFRSSPQRIRIVIRYADYKRFGADSTVTFGDTPPSPKPHN